MKFICLLSLIFSSSVFASFRVGKYCNDYLENKSGARAPFFQNSWDLKEDGTVVLSKNSPATPNLSIIRFDEFKKVTFMKENPTFASKIFAEFKYDKQNRLEKLVIGKGDEDNQKASSKKTIITFAYEDGQCYPLEEVISTNDDKDKNIKFNTLLCRELTSYFKDNPKALECKCGDDITNKDLTKMLLIHGVKPDSLVSNSVIKVDTKMKVYERVEVELLKKIPALSLPTLYALNKLSECKNIPGVYEAMMDDDLWKTKEQTKDLRGVGDAIKENQ
ncbi:MAG: hypothetical protein A2202_05765 [Bdellovibrionales bacterium RIFOXYA1_FULL_36_14]|nr:MAG: hypothetical protein A2202_05765 [Bdellovibrionales bacterium RIFOXYA1_FULL_36_14]